MEPPSDQKRTLIDLPHDILLSCIDHIDRKRDLYNLSLTCRALEDVCLRRLYQAVAIGVTDTSAAKAIRSVPLLRPHVIGVLKELAVRNGERRRRTSGPAHAGYRHESVADIIRGVPPNQLLSFSLYDPSPMGKSVLAALANQHSESLRRLCTDEFCEDISDQSVLPERLVDLECRSTNDGAIAHRLIESNRLTLRRLRLGQERQLTERYAHRRAWFAESIPSPSLPLMSLSLPMLPLLREVELCGIDVRPLIPSDIDAALPFCNWARLTIESCAGASDFLRCLSDVFDFVKAGSHGRNNGYTVQLRDFFFRTETPTNALKDALLVFLDSFTGLSTLSLLFENGSILERIPNLLCGHGPTMKTLVLESRIQSRDNLAFDTSRPFGDGGYIQEVWETSINDICHLCPNLIELGMGFPWDDETVRLRKTLLPSLTYLKTIHIRNFPESRVLSQIGDYTIKEYATKFVDWVFPALTGGSKPALETLAIGPTLYETRWRVPRGGNRLPEFKRTHFFGVDWAVTRFSRWGFMLSAVGERYVEEMRCETPLSGVFEQVWLK